MKIYDINFLRNICAASNPGLRQWATKRRIDVMSLNLLMDVTRKRYQMSNVIPWPWPRNACRRFPTLLPSPPLPRGSIVPIHSDFSCGGAAQLLLAWERHLIWYELRHLILGLTFKLLYYLLTCWISKWYLTRKLKRSNYLTSNTYRISYLILLPLFWRFFYEYFFVIVACDVILFDLVLSTRASTNEITLLMNTLSLI